MVQAIVGANWGDEGKGKITDYLAESADIVVRFQGGANAGHTIINPYGRFSIRIILDQINFNVSITVCWDINSSHNFFFHIVSSL